MTRISLVTGTTLGACLATQIAAQDVVLLDDIVASASLTPVIAGETGATVDVLDQEDIENGDLSMGVQLDRLPGTSFSANGGLGSLGSIRVRGLNDFYVGARIDGIDVTDPSYGQPLLDFGGVTRSGLSRVELLKGSQSALYGSQAIAGVVDITTFRATEPGTSFRAGVEFGSHDTKAADLGIATRAARGGLAFSASRIDSDGISAAASGTEADGYEETFVTLSGDFAASETVELGFSALYADSTLEIDGFPAPTFTLGDTDGVNYATRRGARVYALVDAWGIDHEFSLSRFTSDRRDPGGFTSEFAGERDTLGYLGTADRAFGSVTFGLENTREDVVTSDFSGDETTNSAFGEVLIRQGALDLSLAARYDDSDDFGGNLSGRLAAAYEAAPGLTLKAVAGTGFRAPSLYERFSGLGNDDLVVEESRSVELGIVKEYAGGAAVEATAFYTEIDNRIDYVFGSTVCSAAALFGGCFEQVDARTFSRGLEIAAEAPIGERVDAYGSYTYTDAERQGLRLQKVPLHDLVIGVEAEVMPGLSASADLTRVSGKPQLPDYTLLGAGVSYAVTDAATAYLRVDNIGDETYQTSQGYNMPGRTWTLGLRAEF